MIEADSTFPVEVKCPKCGQHEVIGLQLVARLETTRAGAVLGMKAKAGKREHFCHQSSIPGVIGHMTNALAEKILDNVELDFDADEDDELEAAEA